MPHKDSTSIEQVDTGNPESQAIQLWQVTEPDEDITLDATALQIDQAFEAEAARQFIAENFLGFNDLVRQVGSTDNSEWLANAPNRVQEGLADTRREDLVYQSTDWEQATGRADNPTADLIGS